MKRQSSLSRWLPVNQKYPETLGCRSSTLGPRKSSRIQQQDAREPGREVVCLAGGDDLPQEPRQLFLAGSQDRDGFAPRATRLLSPSRPSGRETCLRLSRRARRSIRLSTPLRSSIATTTTTRRATPSRDTSLRPCGRAVYNRSRSTDACDTWSPGVSTSRSAIRSSTLSDRPEVSTNTFGETRALPPPN